MYIITQTSLFDNEEIEILGDLERLKLAIENMPNEEIIKKLRKIKKNGRSDWPVEAMWNTFIASYVFNHRSVNDLLRSKKEMKEAFEELVEYMYENLEGFGEELAGDGKAI